MSVPVVVCKQCATVQIPQQIAGNDGRCTGRCQQRCCVSCGCTETEPCIKDIGHPGREMIMTCAWVAPIPGQEWRRFVCDFCLYKKAEELYNETNKALGLTNEN
jgi:hypothetical protein